MKSRIIVYVLLFCILGAIVAFGILPNFLEAQVRSKVSSLKSDLRSLATAIESYYVDYNSYPDMRATRIPSTTLVEVPPLITTPIAYMSTIPIDPFSPDKTSSYSYNDYTGMNLNGDQDARSSPASFGLNGYTVKSRSPDEIFQGRTREQVAWEALSGDTVYDPTNGTISAGDNVRSGGLRIYQADLDPIRQKRDELIKSIKSDLRFFARLEVPGNVTTRKAEQGTIEFEEISRSPKKIESLALTLISNPILRVEPDLFEIQEYVDGFVDDRIFYLTGTKDGEAGLDLYMSARVNQFPIDFHMDVKNITVSNTFMDDIKEIKESPPGESFTWTIDKIIGTAITVLVTGFFGWLLSRRRKQDTKVSDTESYQASEKDTDAKHQAPK